MSHEEAHYMSVEHEEPDQWHRHSVEEGPPQAEHGSRANVAILAGAFVVITLFVVVTAAATAVYFKKHITELRNERRETTIEAVGQIEYRNASIADLDQYAWEDAQSGTVRIPIEQAMQKVAGRYAAPGE
ncbi:MAG: hypothetical protein H6811_06855 [Phycisphaeraceae bacterium]|nr:hypothetical protein [Phycisphaeraceae bacterium]